MVALKALGMILAGIAWVISAIFSFGITFLIGVAIYVIARKLVRPDRDKTAKQWLSDPPV